MSSSILSEHIAAIAFGSVIECKINFFLFSQLWAWIFGHMDVSNKLVSYRMKDFVQ